MPRYLISFDDGAMDDIAADELPHVADAAHAVVRAAKAAGVWIFGGGIERQQAVVVQPDGRVLAGPAPEAKRALGGFAVVDTETRADALQWAAHRRGLPLRTGSARDHVRSAVLTAAPARSALPPVRDDPDRRRSWSAARSA